MSDETKAIEEMRRRLEETLAKSLAGTVFPPTDEAVSAAVEHISALIPQKETIIDVTVDKDKRFITLTMTVPPPWPFDVKVDKNG